ncbi:MAG: double zinc ribbon domain-containing protein [Paracoccaceae bacterium]
MLRALQLIYPPQCISCEALLAEDLGLCAACWRATPFISGHVCDACGVSLPGHDDGQKDLCDDCLRIARPWHAGRAALVYRDNARRIVLALKHGDRLELAKPAARWMLAAARPILSGGQLVIPVPAHWSRYLRRKYNQAAILAGEVARLTRSEYLPDALVRTRRTAIQDGMGFDGRFRNVAQAIKPHAKRSAALRGRNILLIDDVMTSGATLAAASQACLAAGATQVCVLALARVAKDT